MKTCIRCKRDKELSEYGKRASAKDGLNSYCNYCKSLEQKEYREKNKQKIADYKKQWAIDNPDKTTATKAKYRESNREKLALSNRVYYADNKETILKKGRDYSKTEQGKINSKKRTKTYRNTENGKLNHISDSAKRRFIKLNSTDGVIPTEVSYPLTRELQSLLDTQNHKCNYCNCKISRELQNIHLDHITPLSKGGTHTLDNVQWLCKGCNLSKSDKIAS